MKTILPKDFARIVRKNSVDIHNRKAIFITVDGIGGSGKNTLITGLVAKVNNEEKSTRINIFKESEFGKFSSIIKQYRDEGGLACKDPLILAHLLAANRRHTLASGLLEQKLSDYDLVIQNRYFITTLAYQIEESVNPYKILSNTNGSYVIPSLCVILSCDPKIAKQRVIQRIGREIGTIDIEKTKRVSDVYHEIADRLSSFTYEIDTSSTGMLPQGSEELNEAIAPFVERLYEKYLKIKK